VCKSLIGLFFASEEAKKLGRGEGVRHVSRVGVIGAGVMGGAIASLCVQKGMTARLADVAPKALDAAQLAHRKELEKQRKRRRLGDHDVASAIDRFEVTEQLVGFRHADLVVEAVAERLDVKRKVLGTLAAQMRDDAILVVTFITTGGSVSVIEYVGDVPMFPAPSDTSSFPASWDGSLGERMPTFHGSPSSEVPRAYRSPPAFTRPRSMPHARRVATARSTA